MSALGSKREKFASIFKRVDGLLRNGAIPYEERPLWYDVYKAFPPRVEPMFNRPVPTNQVRQILYHEDVDRVEAFKRYQKLGYLNCFKVADNRSNMSRIISKCQEVKLKHPELDGDKLFTVVEEELQKDGDFVFLGTASGYPSPDRGASGLVVRNLQNGDHWLFDCGEGTQIQAQRSSNVRLGRISNIFISHLHGDHMYGLPGLLCTIDQKGTAGDIALPSSSGSPGEAVVNIYGPQGLRRYLRLALALSRSHMNYTYAVHELILRAEHRPVGWEDWCSLEADPVRDPPLHCERPGRDIHADPDGFWYNINRPDDMGISVHSMAVSHTIPSLGWLIVHPPKPPALCVETARMLGVPDGPLMGELKKGEPVVVNGQTVYPDQVLKAAVRGHRIAIMGDSCNSSELERLLLRLADKGKISQATLDVLVHEATLQDSMREEARIKGHSTPTPVVQLAAQLKTRLLILTHFSHRYTPIGRLDTTQGNGTARSSEKGKPSLQILLEEAKSVPFDGEIILADDLALLPIPAVLISEVISV